MKNVLTVANMRNFENKIMAQGISEIELVKIAALGIFKNIDCSKRTIIVCGSGNNGADGLCLATILKENKCDVCVAIVSEIKSNACKFYFEKCVKSQIEIKKIDSSFKFNDYVQIIDCIYGVGFHGKLNCEISQIIYNINVSKAKVISVDIASGLNADNGIGTDAIKSDLNVAIGELKVGNLICDAKDKIAKNVVTNLVKSCDSKIKLFEKSDAKLFLSERDNNSYKGNFGCVGIMGGSLRFSGACKLSLMSLASLRSGCGISRIIVPDCISQSVMPYLTVSTLFQMPSDEIGQFVFEEKKLNNALTRIDALVFGMGIGRSDEIVKILQYILQNYSIKLVIDADGLDALSKISESIIISSKCKIVITPHLNEFSKLCGLSCDEILQDSVKAANDYAKKLGIIVLLKGCSTIVCDGNETWISQTGSSGMATAGSGDVLDGVIIGLLGWLKVNVKSVCLGAFIAGLSGEISAKLKSDIAMISSDTIENLPNAIKFIRQDD